MTTHTCADSGVTFPVKDSIPNEIIRQLTAQLSEAAFLIGMLRGLFLSVENFTSDGQDDVLKQVDERTQKLFYRE